MDDGGDVFLSQFANRVDWSGISEHGDTDGSNFRLTHRVNTAFPSQIR